MNRYIEKINDLKKELELQKKHERTLRECESGKAIMGCSSKIMTNILIIGGVLFSLLVSTSIALIFDTKNESIFLFSSFVGFGFWFYFASGLYGDFFVENFDIDDLREQITRKRAIIEYEIKKIEEMHNDLDEQKKQKKKIEAIKNQKTIEHLIRKSQDKFVFYKKIEDIKCNEIGIIDDFIIENCYLKFIDWLKNLNANSAKEEDLIDSIISNTGKIQNISIPENIFFDVFRSGTNRDGYCDIFASNQKTFGESLIYTNDLYGCVFAFIFNFSIVPKLSWGHGFYDRDYMIFLSKKLTANYISYYANEPIEKFFNEKYPPVGLRISKNDENCFRLECISYKNGFGYYNLALTINNGILEDTEITEVDVWGKGVFY